MVMEERSEQEGTKPSEAPETVLTRADEPAAPKGMSSEEVERVKSQAIELMERLRDATGSKEMEVVDTLANMGVQAQRRASSELNLLRGQVGELLSEGGSGRDVVQDLVELRVALNLINPHELNKSGWLWWYKAVSALPFQSRFKFLLKVLQKIAIRYEGVSKQVTAIETRLREGRAMLTRDNIELRKLYEQVEAQQMAIQKNAYLGELLMQELQKLQVTTTDLAKRDRIVNVLFDTSMRVQDLRTMEEVHVQFFVSMEMTRQNNNRLGQAVERTLSLAGNVVIVGLAIQSALVRQRQVLEATQRTREFLGNLIVANAESIRQQTAEIGDVYKNPVIALDKITQAHDALVEAIEMADSLQKEGIDVARDNIAELTRMSASLMQKAAGLLPEGDKRPGPGEA